MRALTRQELRFVSGAGGSCYNPCYDPCAPSKHKKSKGNNGYGNGGHDGSPNGKQDYSR